MEHLELHEFHQTLGATFTRVNEAEAVAAYGDTLAEYSALVENSGIADLSFRSRICLTGGDRVRFLHGQVTNDIKGLSAGGGCYAALVSAKGRMQSDLNIYNLSDELLLDFEPGLSDRVSQHLEKYLVADDVQIVNIEVLYGLLSVQGPEAETVVSRLELPWELPRKPFAFCRLVDANWGEVYLVNQPRLGSKGFDLFVPSPSLAVLADKLVAAAKTTGGRPCGWSAFEIARVEAGIPRFCMDIDETNFPQECGIENRAVSYTKGCYLGQEVLNRIHTLGHVNQELRGLRLSDQLKSLPMKRDKLFHAGREVGYVTSSVASPKLKASIALGYVRKEANGIGCELGVETSMGKVPAQIVELPFHSKMPS
jgi:aminomethyltransferase